MSKNLMIIESPNKVHTLYEFLSPKEWDIIATVGHIRELKKHNGYDLKTFEPTWEVKKPQKNLFGFLKKPQNNEERKTAQQIIDDINKAAHKAKHIYLASDPDREGEAIAWHVEQVLEPTDRKKCERVTFNEITKEAVLAAIKKPRKIDMDLVHAYFARTILDQMVGFGLSRLVREKLHAQSAGRVQTVALKFIHEREKEIEAFSSDKWYKTEVKLNGPFQYPLSLREVSKSLKGVDLYLLDKDDNQVKNQADAYITAFANKQSADKFTKSLGKYFEVYKKEPERHITQQPKAPFKTSVLLSTGAQFVGSAGVVKQTAQHLFEGIKLKGKHVALITYPRTDSVRVSAEFIANVKKLITKDYGANMFVHRNYEDSNKKTTTKIQGAHEAIRVVDPFIKPSDIKNLVKPNEYKLYKLIWMRSVSAFMPESKSISVTLRIKNNENKFYTHNSKLVTPGFRIVDEIDEDRKVTEKFDFSVIREGDKFTAKSIESKEAEKAPPARFNEASLVKVLESEGVGRPSTYFAMVHKPVEANYAYLQNKAYHMNKLGTEVVTGLEKFFPDIITPVFTKDLEEHLDKIEDGDADWHVYLKKYYPIFHKELDVAEQKFKKVEPEKATDEKGNIRLCPKCKSPLVKRYSPKTHKEFIACSAYPLCNYTEFPKDPNHHPQKIIEEECPECLARGEHHKLAIRTNRRNEKFIGCTNYPKCRYARPADMTDAQYQKHKIEVLKKKEEKAKGGPAKTTKKPATKKKSAKK